ncbi:MAG TPA: hypothetical protein VN864_01455 [Thermoplasmata archaeon]|nr:hypothetical protein [Thermoplasmata archaeon]
MHTYIDLYFTPDGVSPLEIADRLRHQANLEFIVGPHDLVFQWASVEDFRTTLEKIHKALHGTGVSYRVQSTSDDPMFVEPVAWPPSLQPGPQQHPGYPHRP